MGDLDGGWYENGIYHLTLTFAPDFPEVLPRPKFATKMFHPQISEDGFPYLSVSMADSKVSAFIWVAGVVVLALPASHNFCWLRCSRRRTLSECRSHLARHPCSPQGSTETRPKNVVEQESSRLVLQCRPRGARGVQTNCAPLRPAQHGGRW